MPATISTRLVSCSPKQSNTGRGSGSQSGSGPASCSSGRYSEGRGDGVLDARLLTSDDGRRIAAKIAKLPELTVAKAKSAEKEHTQQYHYNKAKYQNHHELIRTTSIPGITVVGHRRVIRSRESEAVRNCLPGKSTPRVSGHHRRDR